MFNVLDLKLLKTYTFIGADYIFRFNCLGILEIIDSLSYNLGNYL